METTPRDPQLWHQAKSRARFKASLFTYVAVNALLWVIWAVTSRHQFYPLPWPAWSTIFWGFGLLIQGVNTYGGYGRGTMMEREYERLLREKQERLR
jgi:hypothetical protein